MSEPQKPQNIFVQIMTALKILNENIVTLGENLSAVNDKIDSISGSFKPVEDVEPKASGEK